MPPEDIHIREFQSKDKGACLEIFDSNCPDFFKPEEKSLFISHLDDANRGSYLVAESSGRILACGGFRFVRQAGTARLTWGMVHRSQHRRGLGKILLRDRLKRIKAAGFSGRIGIQTTTKSMGFFEHENFVVDQPALLAAEGGLDLVEMVFDFVGDLDFS